MCEAACVDVTHLCSAVFYDSGPFMHDAAESCAFCRVLSTQENLFSGTARMAQGTGLLQ